MAEVNIRKPELKATVAHRFATDTAIEWRPRLPNSAQPPQNVPTFAGQLIAVQTGANTCKLFVGSDDISRWIEVV